jgi:hypothetical protein
VACRPGFFLPVRVLSRLFRRLFLTMLAAAHAEGRLGFFGALETLAVPRAFSAFLKRQRRIEWVVYAKAPFAGPKAVLAYLARYTHRIAISNRRLIRADAGGVTFSYKDYRVDGPGRFKTMTLATHEFIRRFLMHVLPKGFRRIRHYGLLANGNRAAAIAKARGLLAMAPREDPEAPQVAKPAASAQPLPCCCPRCGGRMVVMLIFAHSWAPDVRAPPATIVRLDTSMMPYLPPARMPPAMAGGRCPVRMLHVPKHPADQRLQPSRFDEVGIPADQRCPAHWALTSCSAGGNVIGTIASSALAESP